ncbi:hypothetical protein VTL71DRAFT_14634 [Oculimacula yallundae]|uniref:Uncharacterized protein n=1 Tax=Oculimacula yallundae TaxID=86028 RepID=A0ABR4CJ22_9HELO
MYPKIAIISALADLATAAPVSNYEPTGPVANTERFIATEIHNTSPAQNTGISANSGSSSSVETRALTVLLLQTARNVPQKPTTSSNQTDTTSATVFFYNRSLQTLSLSIFVPGGQQVFFCSDGSLGFTSAHSGALNDSYVSPFQYTAQTEGGVVGELDVENLGFNACPDSEGPNGDKMYKIFSRALNLEGQSEECIDTQIANAIWSGPNPYEYS